jgi:hypothetical protein
LNPNLNGFFSNDIQEHNSSFYKTKIKVFAFGNNRNGSDITEEAFEIAKPSLFNIPIVAKFSNKEDKFGSNGDLEGHNTYLETDEDGNMEIKMDTYPIGIVSSDAEITYEQVNEGTDDVPDIKTYVTVDKVYLWKRYEATQKIYEWLQEGIDPKVSMEIGNVTGKFKKGSKHYTVTSFEFEAICALGSDVEPCFPMAQIEEYSRQTFEESFYQMVRELKYSLNKEGDKDALQEGGKSVDEILKMLEKYSVNLEDLTAKDIKHEEYTLEQLEEKVKEVFAMQEFRLTSEQLECELRRELAEIETLQEIYWGEIYTYPRYSYVDNYFDTNVIVAYDNKNGFLCGGSYTVANDNVEIESGSLVRYKVDFNPMNLEGDPDPESDLPVVPSDMVEYKLKIKEAELQNQFKEEKEQSAAQYEQLKKEFDELNEKFSTVNEELTKRLDKENDDTVNQIFEGFSEELTEIEMQPVRDAVATLSLDEIEEKLFSIAGRKKVKLNKPQARINMSLNLEMNAAAKEPKQTDDVWAEQKQKFSAEQ